MSADTDTAVTQEDLATLRHRAVRVSGEIGNWRVVEVEGENCVCEKPVTTPATAKRRKNTFHFSQLTFTPAMCNGHTCPSGCQVP